MKTHTLNAIDLVVEIQLRGWFYEIQEEKRKTLKY